MNIEIDNDLLKTIDEYIKIVDKGIKMSGTEATKLANITGIITLNIINQVIKIKHCQSKVTNKEKNALTNSYKDIKFVIPETKWLHNNGTEYKVLFIANYSSTNPKYPKTVVYRGPNGRIWSRPLSDWYRSFTLIGE